MGCDLYEVGEALADLTNLVCKMLKYLGGYKNKQTMGAL